MSTRGEEASRDRLITTTAYDPTSQSSFELKRLHHVEQHDYTTHDKASDAFGPTIRSSPVSDGDNDRGTTNKTRGSHPYKSVWLYSRRLHIYWTNGWVPEMLSCGLSLSALICLITTLRYLEGYALIDMPLKISINTLVAVFAAVIKSSLLLPVAEGNTVLQLQS